MCDRRRDEVLCSGLPQEARYPINVEDVEMCKGLVDEDETARPRVLHHESDQENQGFDHLLATGCVTVVQRNEAFAVKVEFHLETSLGENHVVCSKRRQLSLYFDNCDFAQGPKVFRIATYRRSQHVDICFAGSISQ